MPSVTLSRGRHKGWDAWFLRHGRLTLILVPQVGGRVMGALWRGHDLFFTQPEREGVVEDVDAVTDVGARKTVMGFPLWGGDKTWLGPQERWTLGVPFLELDSGPYTLSVDRETPDEVSLRMTSVIDRETGVRVERELSVAAESPGWSMTHRLLNVSAETVEWGLWDVAMVCKPGRVYLPRASASRYPSGVKTFEDEGDSAALRDDVVGELGGLAVVRHDDHRKYKYGVDAAEGWMLGVFETDGGLVGYCKQAAGPPGRRYPHGCTAEVFNSDRYPYMEMELLGPVAELAPGGSVELRERQALFDVATWPVDEAAVRRLVV